MKISIRKATKDDAPKLAKISLIASGGTFDLLLKNMKKGVQPEDVLLEMCKGDNTEYSHKYFLIAETEDNQIMGGVNVITVANRYKLAPNINPILKTKFKFGILQLFKFYWRAKHLKGMNELKAPKNSLHINDIAVFEEYRGYGVGEKLVESVKNMAQEEKLDFVSLYVWADNESAIRFYKRLGFYVDKVAKVVPHKYLPHSSSYLMLYKIQHAKANNQST